MSLTLTTAQSIISHAMAHGKAHSLKPLGCVVMDHRGVVLAAAIAENSALARFDIAAGKARACLMFNNGTRGVEKLAKDRSHFFAGATTAIQGGLVPVPGGVLIKDKNGTIAGAIGVSGDTSDNDEAAAMAGIAAAGMEGVTG